MRENEGKMREMVGGRGKKRDQGGNREEGIMVGWVGGWGENSKEKRGGIVGYLVSMMLSSASLSMQMNNSDTDVLLGIIGPQSPLYVSSL